MRKCKECINRNRIVNGYCDFEQKDGTCFELIQKLCQDCGVTLNNDFELKDKRCANCQADYIRRKAKATFKATIDMLNYLDEDDFIQDNELANLYDELEHYFTR